MADRDPEVIKQEIAEARDRLASTVDLLAERANPQRVADDVKARALDVVRRPAVQATLGGLGVVTALGVLRRIWRFIRRR